MPDDDRRSRSSQGQGHLPPFSFPDPTPTLTDDELRDTVYEIFVSSCRASSSRPLTFISSSSSSGSGSSAATPSLQRSTTTEVVRKALGLKVKVKGRESMKGGSGSVAGQRKRGAGGGVGVGEVLRVQLRVSEQTDSRVRRALLRIAAGQVQPRDAFGFTFVRSFLRGVAIFESVMVLGGLSCLILGIEIERLRECMCIAAGYWH